MSRVDAGAVSERKEDSADRADQRLVVATGQIGAADASRKQGVPYEEIQSPPPGRTYFQADPPGAVTRGVMGAGLEVAKGDRFTLPIEAIDVRRCLLQGQPEHPRLIEGTLIEKQVVPVQVHRDTEDPFHLAHTGDVIDVRVRQQHVLHAEVLARDEVEQPVHLIPRIDDDALARTAAGDNEAVLLERRHSLGLDYDHAVILAILDDLLFTSKIRAAAAQAGVSVAIARSKDAALADMRARRPALVILDLNNPRTDPIGIISDMRADPALHAIPTVGYVSHVDTATIDAARNAGIGEVLPRSAFTTKLSDIVARGR